MGDYAEDAIEQGYAEMLYDAFSGHEDGEMDGIVRRRRRRKPRTECKFCGATGLMWSNASGRWLLVDQNTAEVHTCEEYKSSIPTNTGKE